MNTKYFAFRRTVAIGAVWAAGMAGLIATSTPASGQTAVDPGTGTAYAQGYKIDPRSGRLSFGLTYGMALAGHQNKVAVGEARSLDLGVIGTTLAGEGCDGGDPTYAKEDQPQPLVVRSGEENAASGKTESENGVEKYAKADDSPLAKSRAITAAAGQDGAVLIGSTVSETSSGVIDGKRVATAVTEVSKVSIGGDALVLKGLRWEAIWQSAPAEQVSGTFTIEGIVVGGTAQPIPAGDAIDALAQINPLIEPLGIRIDPPTVRNESGISFVDPLRIGIVPSELRDGVVGGVVGALQPVREALVNALLEMDCGNASYITIADIALGSVTGAGSLNIELGGVTARTGELGQTSLLGELPAFTPPVSLPADSGGVSQGTLGTTGSNLTGGSAPTDSDTSVVTEPAASTSPETAAPALERIAGTRGGPLVLVGLGGLLLLGALAELDRRKMRRAQRSVPMEAMI
ncbi:hypothetical protein [Actinospongicola halichondriae]|uniref:hypothetical protein n=1 Tax=Actinospongicola halichondriae TaxID=3236844 RepID=UPI003D5CF8FB